MFERFDWKNADDRARLVERLRKNQLFIGSTDTVFGLMGAVSAEVQHKIDHVKQRRGKPYLVLVDSMEQVVRLADVAKPSIKAFLEALWPAPVTVILPKSSHAPDYVGSTESVAIRMPHHAPLREVCAYFDFGLYSTSANISGQAIPEELEQVDAAIVDACCCVIDDGQKSDKIASTIIDLTGDELKIVRQGSISEQKIRELFDSVKQ